VNVLIKERDFRVPDVAVGALLALGTFSQPWPAPFGFTI
jgi:hypothetical protein